MTDKEKKTVLAVVKTPGISVHPEDKPITGDPRRVYTIEELKKALPTAKGKPIGINHKGLPIEEAQIESAGWSDSFNAILAELSLPEELIKDIEKGKYKYVSWDVVPHDAEKTEEGIVYRDLLIERLDLLTNDKTPGDPNAEIILLEERGEHNIMTIELMEKVEKRGNQWCVVHCHGPDAGKVIKCFDTEAEAQAMHQAIMARKSEAEYPWDQCIQDQLDRGYDEETAKKICGAIKARYGESLKEDDRPPKEWFDRCVAAVSDKADDPEALCAWVWYYVKQESLKESKEPCVDCKKKAEEIAEKLKKAEELEKKAKELQEALDRTAKVIEETKKEAEKKVSEARKETIKEISTEIEKKLPNEFIKSKWNGGARLFTDEVKRVLYKKKQEAESDGKTN